MKKISTLIAAAMVAVSVSAQDFKVTSAAIADGATILDNSLATVKVANNDVTPTQIMDEGGAAAPITYAGYTFDYYMGVRVTDAPSVASPTGTVHESNVALVVSATKNVDVTFYYRIGSTKSMMCYDQNTQASVSITQTATNPGEDYLNCKGVYQFQAGHTYTVYTRGGTVQLHGISTAAGTYVAPTATIYANVAAAPNADGYSTMTYADGASVSLTGNNTKKFSSAASVTIDGKDYTTTKVSNGAQNTFYAPEGKKLYCATFYSYVNKDALARTPYWKEINGVEYTEKTATIMNSYKDGANPDVITFSFPEGVTSFTFTNTGEQVCFVIEANYDPTDAKSVEAATESAPAKVVKAVKNGRLVIVNGNAEYSVSGAQMK